MKIILLLWLVIVDAYNSPRIKSLAERVNFMLEREPCTHCIGNPTKIFKFIKSLALISTSYDEKAFQSDCNAVFIAIENRIERIEILKNISLYHSELKLFVFGDTSLLPEIEAIIFPIRNVIVISTDLQKKVLGWNHMKINLQGEGKFHPIYTKADRDKNPLKTLSGSKLRAGTFELPPNIFKSENGTYFGPDVETMNAYAHSLGMEIDISEPPKGEKWGVEVNDSRKFSGLTGELIRGEKDIGFANFFLVESYVSIMQPNYPHVDDCMGLVVPTVKHLPRILVIIQPFTAETWIATALLVISSGLVFFFCALIYKTVIGRNPGELKSLSMSMFRSYSAIVGMPSQDYRSTNSVRVVFVALWVTCFFIAVSYKASLISYLSEPSESPPIDTFADLDKSGLKFYLNGFRGLYKGYNESADKHIRRVFERAEYNNNITDSALEVISRRAAFIQSRNRGSYMVMNEFLDEYNQPKLRYAKECLTTVHITSYQPKKSLLKWAFTETAIRLRQQGLVRYWWNRLQRPSMRINPDNKDGYVTIELDDIQSAFIALVGGLSLAAVGFLIEAVFGLKSTS
ncbi:ionotropic receptor 21a-like [Artemia franciscana]|uniref:Ionotropic glutamate receptor C-terminal domain-containing protein n=1 Tax=Artemia franciscana TaxID=6661 RepID=A0AA88HKQ7_ARTSF|nr:hypothetical protein QYM36_013173 [Artemia franciscana]